MQNNTDADYTDRKRTCKNFEIKNGRKYIDLHVQSNTLLLEVTFLRTFKIFGKQP